ncbi:MAG: helix-turn-helix domain-containing protein [Candidatus Accumulibacter sp.]|jgi:lambda repressor-like predicted transcriptional regulator|nr:helix-turn-helix domain-containing protein [Accumulibacter sp.]
MHPEEIKAALRMRGYTQARLAEKLYVNPSTVSQIIAGYGKSARLQKAIARIIGKTVSEIWPNQVILRRRREVGGPFPEDATPFGVQP